jgi:hypothetical protein
MAGLTPGRQREGAQVFQGTAPKLDRFGISHINSIQSFVWPGFHLPARSWATRWPAALAFTWAASPGWRAAKRRSYYMGKFHFFVEEEDDLVSRENCVRARDQAYVFRPSKARNFRGTQTAKGTNKAQIACVQASCFQ